MDAALTHFGNLS